MSDSEDIIRQCLRLKEGEAIRFDLRYFRDAFPSNPWTGESGVRRFFSALPGSGWGCWRGRLYQASMWFEVSRHPEQDRRVFQDWDRTDEMGDIPGIVDIIY